jgi:hypothetical protein
VAPSKQCGFAAAPLSACVAALEVVRALCDAAVGATGRGSHTGGDSIVGGRRTRSADAEHLAVLVDVKPGAALRSIVM